jgi:uncharacterized paraquat-inducible protein A
MSENIVPCPECEAAIDAVSVSLTGYCPECNTPFRELLDAPENDPEDAGPYHQHEDTQ